MRSNPSIPTLALIMGILSVMLMGSCKEDDASTCQTCRSETTPDFELCRESGGNASVNGQDTGTEYEVYLQALQDAGTTCGGF
jgi:hypothetical protein